MQHLSANTQLLKTPVTPMTSILLADRAPNILVLVYKSHYTDYLIKELGIYNSLGNHRCTPTTPNPGQSTNDDELDLPTLQDS
jgi:hypothetical protein